jgi:hypothetical protein
VSLVSLQNIYFNTSQGFVRIKILVPVYHTNKQSEDFEDTKGVIRIRISKKNRQHNDQKKKYKQNDTSDTSLPVLKLRD